MHTPRKRVTYFIILIVLFLFSLAILLLWKSFKVLYFIFFHTNYNCFCLNQLACHHYKTIHKRRVSFHLVYRCIFCLPSRRLMQIIMQGLNIIYSFCSFVLTTEYSYVCCSAFRCSPIWQHSPDSSFSLLCVLQHFVSSIGMRDTHRRLL